MPQDSFLRIISVHQIGSIEALSTDLTKHFPIIKVKTVKLDDVKYKGLLRM